MLSSLTFLRSISLNLGVLKVYKDSKQKLFIVKRDKSELMSKEAIKFANNHPEFFAHIYENYADEENTITIYNYEGDTVAAYVDAILSDFYDDPNSCNFSIFKIIANQIIAMEDFCLENKFCIGLINTNNLLWNGQKISLLYKKPAKNNCNFKNYNILCFGLNNDYFNHYFNCDYSKIMVPLGTLLKKSRHWQNIYSKYLLHLVIEGKNLDEQVHLYALAMDILHVIDEDEHIKIMRSQELYPATFGKFLYCPKLLPDQFLQKFLRIEHIQK
jgi:hypothetical protein